MRPSSSPELGVLRAIVLLTALPNTTAVETLVKVMFPPVVEDAYNAMCLDATPAGYYLAEHPESTGWVIYLQGGGLCFTKEDCKNRTQTVLGSSKDWPPNMTDDSNVLASAEAGNPFGAFNKVWVPYGTGDCFTGTSRVNPHLGGLATTGHNVLNALVDHLINTTEFRKVTHVLFSGGSAGGIGVFHNVDWLADAVRTRANPNAIVKASPQGGYFLPRGLMLYKEFAAGVRIPLDIAATYYVQWLEGGYLNPMCAAALGRKKAQCWDVDVLQRFIKTPLFVAQNQIDSEQVAYQLECSLCSYDPNGTAKDFMAKYKTLAIASLRKFLTDADGTDRVVWAPSCYKHCENLCMAHAQSPAVIDGVSYAAGLGAWFFNGTGSGAAYIQGCPNGELLCTPICGNGCADAPGSPGGTADPPTPPN